MEVKLVVANGKRAGEGIVISGPKFIIGRAEDCHLRPQSEQVSRHHCVIFVDQGFVAVRDFGSRNGTFVNGEVLTGERELKPGDLLRIGDLEFELRVDVPVGGKKKPKVQSVKEAAERTVESTLDDELDLDSWLKETDTADATAISRGAGDDTITGITALQPTEELKKKEKSKDVVGVSKNWKPSTEKPQDAAADTLKNFFKRR